MCAKTSQKDVAQAIRELGEFGSRPDGMDIDPDAKIYYRQYDIDYEVESTGARSKSANRLKLNLYFDPIRRSIELLELDICMIAQRDALDELMKSKSALGDDATIKREYCYYKVVYDHATRIIESFEPNEKKLEKVRSLSGFFSIITQGVEFDAMKVLRTYRLRDEQEKYFNLMKDLTGADRQRNWSEEGKTGRLFILFSSLTLSSHLRHIWKSTELYDMFSSSLDILDEMRSIRCIEHTNRAKVITPFVGAQVDICKAFGFEIPKGCAPAYVSQQKSKRKRGRPSKKIVERDL
jgi:hypothetical protein